MRCVRALEGPPVLVIVACQFEYEPMRPPTMVQRLRLLVDQAIP